MKAVFKPTKKKVSYRTGSCRDHWRGFVFNAKAKAALAAAGPMYNTAAVEKKDLKKEVSVNGTIGSVDKSRS